MTALIIETNAEMLGRHFRPCGHSDCSTGLESEDRHHATFGQVNRPRPTWLGRWISILRSGGSILGFQCRPLGPRRGTVKIALRLTPSNKPDLAWK